MRHLALVATALLVAPGVFAESAPAHGDPFFLVAESGLRNATLALDALSRGVADAQAAQNLSFSSDLLQRGANLPADAADRTRGRSEAAMLADVADGVSILLGEASAGKLAGPVLTAHEAALAEAAVESLAAGASLAASSGHPDGGLAASIARMRDLLAQIPTSADSPGVTLILGVPQGAPFPGGLLRLRVFAAGLEEGSTIELLVDGTPASNATLQDARATLQWAVPVAAGSVGPHRLLARASTDASLVSGARDLVIQRHPVVITFQGKRGILASAISPDDLAPASVASLRHELSIRSVADDGRVAYFGGDSLFAEARAPLPTLTGSSQSTSHVLLFVVGGVVTVVLAAMAWRIRLRKAGARAAPAESAPEAAVAAGAKPGVEIVTADEPRQQVIEAYFEARGSASTRATAREWAAAAGSAARRDLARLYERARFSGREVSHDDATRARILAVELRGSA